MKTKQYIIPLPDAGVYPPAIRKRDTTLFGVDIEDAMLCVLQGLTDRVVETNPEVFMQDLLEQAFDHFTGMFDKSTRLQKDLRLDVEQKKMLTENLHHSDDITFVKQNLAKLLILAEMFLAPYLKQVRDKGKIVTVEAFKRYPTLGTFNATVMDDEPSEFKGWEKDYLSLVKGAYGDFLTELRHDNLRKLTVNTRDSSVSFKLPKPTPLPTDLNTIDAPGYFSGTPVTNAGTPLAPIPEAKLDEILDIIGEGEVSSETFDYSEDGFMAAAKAALMFRYNTEEINHILLVSKRLIQLYGRNVNEGEYRTLFMLLGINQMDGLKNNLVTAYKWYENVLETFIVLEQQLTRPQVYDFNIFLEKIHCSLRALFLGLVWDLYSSKYRQQNPHEVYCKAVFDAESDICIEQQLQQLRVDYPAIKEFSPKEFDDTNQIAGTMYYTTRYEDIGNFTLSDGYLRKQPLFLSLNDGNWSSPYLFGINAQKKTGVVFTVYNPLILLGQANILEYRMADPEFRTTCEGHDAVFHTNIKDPGSNQMVLLEPHNDTVKILAVRKSIIDAYFESRFNVLKEVTQFVQTKDYRLEHDGVIRF